MSDDGHLSDLIGSRICHDLISPLGAIGNGVELLTLSGAGVAPEISLISESIDNANARIRFFRVALGAAPDGARIGRAEIVTILRDLFRAGRIRVAWTPPDDLPRAEAKLAFLALQCLESALPWGGDIRVARDASGAWTLTGTGDRLKFDEALWDVAASRRSADGISPAEVQFALLAAHAGRLGRTLAVGKTGDNTLRLSL